MFTGLIETVGKIQNLTTRGNYKVMTIAPAAIDGAWQIGESVACDGACLTVTKFDKTSFTVEASQETAARTIIGNYRVGGQINLERAMKIGDRLGGHLVSGHVDDFGTVDLMRSIGDSWELAITYDKRFDNLVIEKGSVAINGVSLTVNRVKPGWLSVNVIPHTIKATTLGDLRRGDKVNLEFDMIGKYVLKVRDTASSGNLTVEKLKESGW